MLGRCGLMLAIQISDHSLLRNLNLSSSSISVQFFKFGVARSTEVARSTSLTNFPYYMKIVPPSYAVGSIFICKPLLRNFLAPITVVIRKIFQSSEFAARE